MYKYNAIFLKFSFYLLRLEVLDQNRGNLRPGLINTTPQVLDEDKASARYEEFQL
jgi:hypothetical protein